MSVSIVSGNGFVGHAQRADNEYGLRNYSYALTAAAYDLTFQYRSSHGISVSYAGHLDAATGAAQTVTVNNFTYEGAEFDVYLDDTTSWSDTSSTNMTIPTSHPTSKTFTVSAGQSYHSGQNITVTSYTLYFSGTVVSYNSGTGQLVLNSTSNTGGSGTFANWYFTWGLFGFSTSTTSNSIPTSHPTQVTFTVGTGLSGLSVGTTVSVGTYRVDFYGTVTSYDSGTGSLTMSSAGNSGTATTSQWNISISEDYWWEIGTITLTLH